MSAYDCSFEKITALPPFLWKAEGGGQLPDRSGEASREIGDDRDCHTVYVALFLSFDWLIKYKYN